MNKNFLTVATMLILMMGSPAFADTSELANSNQPQTSTAATPHRKCFIKKVLAVAVGAIVGVPVCAVRKPIDEEKYEMKSLGCDKHKALFVIPAAGLWIPFAVTEGILEAPFFAVNNSLVNYNKPFSREQFSLVETEEPTKP
jgi:hypothetical protein